MEGIDNSWAFAADAGFPYFDNRDQFVGPSSVAPIKTSTQLAPKPQRNILTSMATITEVEKLALDLPESQRAVLATRLLRSLSSVLHDEDEGIAEAFLRDADLDTNPELGMS